MSLTEPAGQPAARGRIPDVIALSDVGATDASVGHNEHEIRDTLPQLLGWEPSLSVIRVSRGQHDVGELLDHLIGAP